jgi:hypothetical protein
VTAGLERPSVELHDHVGRERWMIAPNLVEDRLDFPDAIGDRLAGLRPDRSIVQLAG